MKHFPALILLCLAGLLLAGCAPVAKPDNIAINRKAYTLDQTLHNNMSVIEVKTGTQSKLPWIASISRHNFKQALVQSLKHQSLYLPAGRYGIKATIVDQDQPYFGANMRVTLKVRYTLTDRQMQQTVFEKTVRSSYVVTARQAMLIPKRSRLATEGALRQNIRFFFNALSSLSFSRPSTYRYR